MSPNFKIFGNSSIECLPKRQIIKYMHSGIKMEETLFDSLFAGKHLRDKGSDFDDIFYETTNRSLPKDLEQQCRPSN